MSFDEISTLIANTSEFLEISTLLTKRYRQNIDIDLVIPENIDSDIQIDILENIDINMGFLENIDITREF